MGGRATSLERLGNEWRVSTRGASAAARSQLWTAPLLVLAGKADSRCPIRQVLAYTERLAARDHPHELYLFPTGHAPFQIDERIAQVGVVLDFLARHVPGISVPGGTPPRTTVSSPS